MNDISWRRCRTALQEGFTVARYIDDPVVLGEHPAMAIIAKTSSEKVCVC